MTKTRKKSICIIVDCLTGGGAEKAAASLSKTLFNYSFEVSIITMFHGVTYSYKGNLYSLGKIPNSKTFKKLTSFKILYNKINADVYIDFRVKFHTINEVLFHLFVFKQKKTILTVHSYKVHNYIPKLKILYKKYNQAKAIVVVSKAIKEKISQLYNFTNLVIIPNLYSDEIVEKSKIKINFEQPFILAVGRLNNEVKQFDKLILAFKASKLVEENLSLIILGEGEDRKHLEQIIKENNLENHVKLLGFEENPYPYMKQCKFLVLSSKYEGFGIVLMEALSLGTPVISFDCKSGPSEIIKHKENGLLVENQDFKALTEALDLLFFDNELYLKCKSNSKDSVTKFSEDIVFNKWIELLDK